MTELLKICEGVHALETAIRPAPGFELPLRSTLLSLQSGGLAIVSPVDVDDVLAAKIDALGPVEHVIAPNSFHHLYVKKAAARWPKAKVHISAALQKKRPTLHFDHLLGDALPSDLQSILLEGSPGLDEHVFFHPASRTLVVTDLVFHVLSPRGFLTPMILWMVGAYRCLGQSRALRFATRDRAAAGASVRCMLALDFERLVMAHGEIITHDARARLEAALTWMLAAEPRALTA